MNKKELDDILSSLETFKLERCVGEKEDKEVDELANKLNDYFEKTQRIIELLKLIRKPVLLLMFPQMLEALKELED